MKKQLITMFVSICLFAIPVSVIAGERCKTVTYGQVMDEYNRIIRRIDAIDDAGAFYQFQAAHNMQASHAQMMDEIRKEREQNLTMLMQMLESLEQMQVNPANSLMGSSTGYCMEKGMLKKIKKTIKDASESHTPPKQDGVVFSAEAYKKAKKRRLIQARRLLNKQKDLSLIQIARASTLGSVGLRYSNYCYGNGSNRCQKPTYKDVMLKTDVWKKSVVHGYSGRK